MCGPISGSEYSNKWTVDQCCCGCTLRTGCLILGWIDIIGGILCILGAIFDKNNGYSGYSFIVNLIVGVVLVIGVYKLNAQLVWIAAYICLVQIILQLILAIVCLVTLVWVGAIGVLIGMVFAIYFFLVIRSYAYEVESGRGAANNPA